MGGERHEARLWLPCIDQWVRKTVWTVNVTVARGLFAIASGTLLQQVCVARHRGMTLNNNRSSTTTCPRTRSRSSSMSRRRRHRLGWLSGVHFSQLAPIQLIYHRSPFVAHPDSDIYGVTHFCLPELKAPMLHTVSHNKQRLSHYKNVCSTLLIHDHGICLAPQTVKVFEDILEPLPFGSHHVVFVDEAPSDVVSFAGLSLIRCTLFSHDVTSLHSIVCF